MERRQVCKCVINPCGAALPAVAAVGAVTLQKLYESTML